MASSVFKMETQYKSQIVSSKEQNEGQLRSKCFWYYGTCPHFKNMINQEINYCNFETTLWVW